MYLRGTHLDRSAMGQCPPNRILAPKRLPIGEFILVFEYQYGYGELKRLCINRRSALRAGYLNQRGCCSAGMSCRSLNRTCLYGDSSYRRLSAFRFLDLRYSQQACCASLGFPVLTFHSSAICRLQFDHQTQWWPEEFVSLIRRFEVEKVC